MKKPSERIAELRLILIDEIMKEKPSDAEAFLRAVTGRTEADIKDTLMHDSDVKIAAIIVYLDEQARG